ncbi:anaerobic glycerol-3-phosphate dehydrogenase subunit GlpA [Candidatus Oscillochloris fontis]|uniref:anaerobic glycerol-3-phosphate dehydrogenase subunit GlpA n=1 Tax=Candidatus Oscillochloris fontis TaxID=2496868 RepID=UPI00101DA0B5|nr:anaerobic glycerol-3-phosphate dehydrogenase subunit GlpA [Candidatus Oscillochloris fontis]
MQTISTDVLVIGGGATGSGVLRDLAMRGMRAILVEKGDLTHGTTGRYHGLLHSGGRYVTKDPQSANECARENAILRRIMPHCIEDTSGFFVITPWDDPDYGDLFMANCRKTGVPVGELPLAEMHRRERVLNPQISRAFEVADAAADSFLAAHTNVLAAREYGAQVFTYHTLIALLRVGDQVVGAVVEDLRTGERKQIDSACVLNATGAWAGKVAALAGVKVTVLPGKGTLVAMNHRMVNTVINRCKMPADGDIIVPVHSVAVIGTTDTFVPDPDFYGIEAEEVQFMLDEGEKLIPGFKQYRALRAWAGVRPLYKDQDVANDRDLSRTYKLLDHAQRDGVEGIISLVGGKWTTYRLMAEDAANLIAQRLGNTQPCRTAEEVMPAPPFERRDTGNHADGPSLHWLGKPLAAIEQTQAYNDLICECELVTRSRLQTAMASGASNLDDLRRMVRVGMGPCQGGWCIYRSSALLYEEHSANADFSIEYANAALLHFLQERWRGLTPVLWGDQLRQARLDELIFAGLLGIHRLRDHARQGGGLVTPE